MYIPLDSKYSETLKSKCSYSIESMSSVSQNINHKYIYPNHSGCPRILCTKSQRLQIIFAQQQQKKHFIKQNNPISHF